ncbi:methanol/ethanol family PQQ-dependent dehydrogenase [Coralloluteibacterium thermophilus]|uniref:Methanol/ethanol family PQQ-dependent dehydrogenase n=1 Tax=Coralloluteibacterium thermophilum TaxID=2707049 RepID=A0ABV9NJZ4_9GAMM
MNRITRRDIFRVSALTAALALAVTGCNVDATATPNVQQQAGTPAAQTAQNQPASSTARTVDSDQEFQRIAADADNWGGIGRDFALTRHSPLSGINRDNVRDLRMSWEMKTNATRGHEGQPLVIDDRMYFVSAYPNHVYAVDLSEPDNGKVLWHYTPEQDERSVAVACCDTVNRGASYGDGKIVFGSLSGDIIALDAETGREVWKKKLAHPDQGETVTMAPIIANGKVVAGISGNEFGVLGRVVAYNLADGSEVWNCAAAGSDQDLCLGADFNKANPHFGQLGDLGIKSFPGEEWKRGGGAAWGWYSYDPDLKLVYYGTGNPGLWSPSYRCGADTHEECNNGEWDNKWSMTTFARNIDTGEAVWGYQKTPFDQWDYDGVNEPILVDLTIDGRQVPALVQFDRNGFVYVHDRRDGTLLRTHKYVNVNWAERVDMETGRPVKVAAHSPFERGKNVSVSPSAMGGKDQQPCSVDPAEPQVFFCGTNNWYMELEPQERGNTMLGLPYVFANVMMKPEKPGALGIVKAFDVLTGQSKWEIEEAYPVWSGTLVTDGGLVFYGTLDGWFRAVDKETGEKLWETKLPSGVIGNAIAYRANGNEYISVFSGIGGWIGLPVTAGLDPSDPYGALGAAGLAFSNNFQDIPLGGMVHTFRIGGAGRTIEPPAVASNPTAHGAGH